MQVADTESLYFLPWRDADGYNVVDRDGVWVASVPHADARAYAVEAANAYPRLKAALDKALEACGWLMDYVLYTEVAARQSDSSAFAEKASKALEKAIEAAKDAIVTHGESALEKAREALEMAKGRDGDANS